MRTFLLALFAAGATAFAPAQQVCCNASLYGDDNVSSPGIVELLLLLSS